MMLGLLALQNVLPAWMLWCFFSKYTSTVSTSQSPPPYPSLPIASMSSIFCEKRTCSIITTMASEQKRYWKVFVGVLWSHEQWISLSSENTTRPPWKTRSVIFSRNSSLTNSWRGPQRLLYFWLPAPDLAQTKKIYKYIYSYICIYMYNIYIYIYIYWFKLLLLLETVI